MYEEEKKTSFIKDFIIKLLYMFLFLFLFMWLYPAPKVDLSEVEVKVDKTELEPLFAGIFNDNITAMKEAARSYYTTDRLPETNGDSTKMTLQEMLNKKIVSPFVDANGKTCDTSASYVEVTRISSTEYTMKVNLSCSDKTDYIIETIGCTSVCPGCVSTPSPVSSTTTASTKVITTSTTNKSTSTNSSSSNNSSVSYVTVLFDSNGGTSVTGQTIPKGSKVNSPTTTRDGYNFLCWSTKDSDSSCSSAYNFNNAVNSNMTLYAQWSSASTTIYKYTKTIDTWEDDTTWTTEQETTSDSIKLLDTKYTYEEEETTQTKTYRTVSWIFGQTVSHSYELYINDIPSDATNVRIYSSSKITSTSDLRSYVSNRYSCDIQMVGYSCPSRTTANIIQDRDIYSTPIAKYTYSKLSIYRSGSRWIVPISFYNSNVISGNYDSYIVPIKFTVKWTEVEETKVKNYKYSRRTQTVDTKYSTSANDTNLLNNGYTFAGTK